MDILVVDDNAVLRRNVSRSLQRAGHIVHDAASGADARQILKNENIGVICLDLDLPDCHGLDLFEEVQASLPDIQVIVMTGTGDDDRERAEGLGVKEFLLKPFRLARIHSLVREMVASYSIK